jgi:hypothetical protein
MLVDFHRLLDLGVTKFNSPRFDGQLQLLPEHLALIRTVWSCIVPFAVQDLLQLFYRLKHMIRWQLWCELGFLIFRKVLITLDLVESRHNSIQLPNNSALNPAITGPRPLWLSTGVARSTSPRRLSPCLRIENTCKNTKECNQIVDEWLILQSWGLINWRRRRNCYQQNNLSKTQP